MGSYSTVACQEVHDTHKESRNSTGWTISVTLQCAWSDRYNLLIDLLDTPRPHPTNTWLYATEAQIVPMASKYTQSGQEIVYEEAFLDVTYSVPGGSQGSPTPQDPVKLISESIEPYTKVIRLPPKRFKWKSDKKLLESEEAPGKVLHGIKLTRTIFKVPTISNTILDLPGTVHDANYTSSILNLTFNSGTLLFMPPVLNRNVTTVGAGAWELKLSWDYFKYEWNRVWRVDPSTDPALGGGKDGYDSLVYADDDTRDYNSFPLEDHGAFLF